MSGRAAIRDHCLSPSRARHRIDASVGPQKYGRLFPDVPSFTADQEFLYALGRAGGICDCGSTDEEPASEGNIAAGWPIFGQLIAHDITADRSAPQPHIDVKRLRNFRSPQLDLETLYGDGPIGHPFLYQRDDSAKFLLGGRGEDLPRNPEGIALSGDPRDDSHLLISQLHLAMLKIHNLFVDRARVSGVEESNVFDTARRHTCWTYQWIVVHEFLPTLVGRELVDDILDRGPRYFRPTPDVFIPLEFADAAYRYGHCQIRHRYLINATSQPMPVFPDMLGFRPVPADRRVDWALLFDTPGRERAQRAKKIDGKLVGSLIQLPVAITGECDVEAYHSLAVRDLQRGQGARLPSGEALARHIGVQPLTADEVGLAAIGWRGETPLWYYILREADVRAGGHLLGPLGGLIVGEVLLGLLGADSSAFLTAPATWQPSDAGAQSHLAELLASVGNQSGTLDPRRTASTTS